VSFAHTLPPLTIARGRPRDFPASVDDGWEVHYDHRGHPCAYTRAIARGGWLHIPGLARYRFEANGADLEAFPEPGVTAGVVREGYFRVALPMALLAMGHEVLHASAVRRAGSVHVFCGASHAGKSTLAYALSLRGFEVWADDAVAFTRRDGTLTALPLPFALRLRPDAAEFFRPGGVRASADGKTEALRHQPTEPLRIGSVSVLEEGGGAAITQLRASEALPAVLYHSFYLSLAEQSVQRRMAREFLDLVAGVPVFRVSLGRGLDRIAGLVDDLEQRVLAGSSAPAPGGGE